MLLDLPTDLLNILVDPEFIGLSGVFAIRHTCHFLRGITKPVLPQVACASAAADGHHTFINWALESGCDISIFTCAKMAAGNNRVETLDYLYNHGLVNHHPIVIEAVRGGHLDVLKYIHQRFFKCIRLDHAIEISAYVGHLHILQWLYDEHPLWLLTCDIPRRAVSGGHLEVIKWYTTLPGIRQFNSEDMLTAVYNGHVHIVEWVVGGGRIIADHDAIDYANHAARYGQLNMLKWLIVSENLKLSTSIFNNALTRLSPNTTDVLQVANWLHEQKCPYDVGITDIIMNIICDKIYALRWLKDNGYPISPRAAEFYNTYN